MRHHRRTIPLWFRRALHTPIPPLWEAGSLPLLIPRNIASADPIARARPSCSESLLQNFRASNQETDVIGYFRPVPSSPYCSRVIVVADRRNGATSTSRLFSSPMRNVPPGIATMSRSPLCSAVSTSQSRPARQTTRRPGLKRRRRRSPRSLQSRTKPEAPQVPTQGERRRGTCAGKEAGRGGPTSQ